MSARISAPASAADPAATTPEAIPGSVSAPAPRSALADRSRPVRIRIRGRVVASFRLRLRTAAVLLALTVAGLAVCAVTLSTGDFTIPVTDVVRTLFGGGSTIDQFVIEQLRLPRLLTGLLVGAALGAGGAVFQSLSRNPLGSPDIVGFDTGAATGALIVLTVIHGSAAQTAAGAVLGGVATAIAVYLLAMRRGVQGYRLILIGIRVGSLLSAVNGYLLTRASVDDAQSAAVWLIGSLNGRGWSYVRPEAIVLVVLLPTVWLLSHGLSVLELGDELGRGLGLRVEALRAGTLVVGVALSAAAVAAA